MEKVRFEFVYRVVRKLRKAFPSLSAITLVDMTSAWVKGPVSDAAAAVAAAYSATDDESLLFPSLIISTPRRVAGPAKGMLP